MTIISPVKPIFSDNRLTIYVVTQPNLIIIVTLNYDTKPQVSLLTVSCFLIKCQSSSVSVSMARDGCLTSGDLVFFFFLPDLVSFQTDSAAHLRVECDDWVGEGDSVVTSAEI